jgi:hypothetical protein
MNNSNHKNNKIILLIEPPFYRFYHDQYCLVKYPLALGYLSETIIKNFNWLIQTYNADFNVRKKAFEFVDNHNSEVKFRRGIASLRTLGVRVTLKRVYRYFYSKFLNYIIVKSN